MEPRTNVEFLDLVELQLPSPPLLYVKTQPTHVIFVTLRIPLRSRRVTNYSRHTVSRLGETSIGASHPDHMLLYSACFRSWGIRSFVVVNTETGCR